MPGKILGIDISEHSISAVQVISGLKGYQVVSCFTTPVINNNLEKALEELSGRFDLKSDKCLLSIPTANTSFRNINTPFKDSKKIRQTLPFEIEMLVPFSVDEKIIDYIHTDESTPESILAAATGKGYIENYIEQLKAAGIEPDIIDIRPVPVVAWLLDQEDTPESGIYLDLEPEHPCVVIFENKKIVLIRELPCSFAKKTEEADSKENSRSLSEPIENILSTICREADRTIYSFNSKIKSSFTIERIFFGGRLSVYNNMPAILNNFFETPAERINISSDTRLKMDAGLSGIYKPALMDNALAVSMRESKKSIGYNLRRGEFAVKRNILGPGKDVKRAAILICIFLVLMFVNTGVDYYNISKKHTMVEDRFKKEFENRIPNEESEDTKRRIRIAQQKIKELENPSEQVSGGNSADQKILDILREISRRVDEKYDFYVETFSVGDNVVTINATTDDYGTADKIKNALKGSDMLKIVEESPYTPTKGKRISFKLKFETT